MNRKQQTGSIDDHAVRVAMVANLAFERSDSANVARNDDHWFFPIKDGGEIRIPNLAFEACNGDRQAIDIVLASFIDAYRGGKRPAERYMTETCTECLSYVRGGRHYMESGCMTHGRREEAILSSQGSLNDAESDALRDVRAFLYDGGDRAVSA